MSYFLCFLTHQ